MNFVLEKCERMCLKKGGVQSEIYTGNIFEKDINPLPSITLRSAWDLNVPCWPKCSKALLLPYTFKLPLKKTQSFCPCSRALNRSGKGLKKVPREACKYLGIEGSHDIECKNEKEKLEKEYLGRLRFVLGTEFKQLDHWQYYYLDALLELLTGAKKNAKTR
jgi:hypothetical protein